MGKLQPENEFDKPNHDFLLAKFGAMETRHDFKLVLKSLNQIYIVCYSNTTELYHL